MKNAKKKNYLIKKAAVWNFTKRKLTKNSNERCLSFFLRDRYEHVLHLTRSLLLNLLRFSFKTD